MSTLQIVLLSVAGFTVWFAGTIVFTAMDKRYSWGLWDEFPPLVALWPMFAIFAAPIVLVLKAFDSFDRLTTWLSRKI